MTEQTLVPSPYNAVSSSADEYLVYNLESRKLHRLNSTAALIMELCAGGKTSEDVGKILAPVPGEISHACRMWVNYALDEGLLIPLAATVSNRLNCNPQDFTSMASDLRDDGEILAALVCQQYATELLKDNADSWLALGELAHIAARRETAKEAYQEYLKLCPGNAEARHILQALLDKPPPSRAPDECIQQLYARFATFYDQNMCGELDYSAPSQLKEMIEEHIETVRPFNILELGCGTGLAGKILKPLAKNLVGIDLSKEMIEQSKATDLYNDLHVAEITSYLAKDSSNYDLIAACDTFIYFGDLHQVIAPSAERLRSGGQIIFTVEKGEDLPFKLTDSGRYAHTEEHVRSVAKKAGLEVVAMKEGFLRQEYGEPVTGLIVLLGKPSQA